MSKINLEPKHIDEYHNSFPADIQKILEQLRQTIKQAAPNATENELTKYNTSKGAIQFPIDKPLPLTLIKKIVRLRVSEDSKK
jgi:uncharacterized protein YdhG (YjbR/CyaY superfamily)